jgi:hypothetical protein
MAMFFMSGWMRWMIRRVWYNEGKGRALDHAALFLGVYNRFTTRRDAGLHEVYRKKNRGSNALINSA